MIALKLTMSLVFIYIDWITNRRMGSFLALLVEKLNSGWRGFQAEVSYANCYPEVTLTSISAVLDLAPTATYNNYAFPMRRIGQRRGVT